MKKPIYLAGAIVGRTDQECRQWRIEATGRALPYWPVLNPMRNDYRGRELMNIREIVEGDLADITASWALIAMFDAPSVGTSMEIFNAYHSGRPVVLINRSVGAMLSPWLIYHCARIVTSVEEAVAALIQIAAMNPGIDAIPPEAPEAPPLPEADTQAPLPEIDHQGLPT